MKPIKLALLTCLAACSAQAQWTWESLNQTTTLGNGDIFCVQQIQSGNWTNKWEYTTNVIESLLGLSGIGYALPISPGANITITTNAAGLTISGSAGGVGGGGSATIQTNSVNLATGVTNFNFVGAGSAAVTGSTTPGSATITITSSGSGGSGLTNAGPLYAAYASDGNYTNVNVGWTNMTGVDPNQPREFFLTLTTNMFLSLSNAPQGSKMEFTLFQDTAGQHVSYLNGALITNVSIDFPFTVMQAYGISNTVTKMRFEYMTNFSAWVPIGYAH